MGTRQDEVLLMTDATGVTHQVGEEGAPAGDKTIPVVTACGLAFSTFRTFAPAPGLGLKHCPKCPAWQDPREPEPVAPQET